MTRSRARLLFISGYLLAAMLVLVPLLEGMVQGWPPTPGVIRWRYGLIGYAGNNLALPVAGGVLALVTAALLEHQRLLRVLSVVGLMVTLALLAGMGMFALDWLDLRNTVDPRVRDSFDASALEASANLAFGALAIGWGSLAGLRATGSGKSGAEQGRSPGIVSAGTSG